MRLDVPLFQRQYVWSREQQWEPLWEDIERKFIEYLEGRKDAPVHFLGAMVLDQKQTPVTHVEKRQVIDGQQRLTTLQVFLAAFRNFCREQDADELARECEGYTLNKGMMADLETERFKVWPTQLDRTQFVHVVGTPSRAALEVVYPLVRQKYARKADPRPRMVEAYLFFHSQLHEFFLGTTSEPPLAADQPITARLEECFQALRNALQVVVIDLEQDDDAQVIFETLNARGEPLLPADLLRNFIFLRAGRAGEPQEELYNEYWRAFDEAFWRKEIRQGRLNRPRSDLFMQHFLASRQAVDVPAKHLFVEYKHWIERQKPFNSVREELAVLSRQGADFRRLIEPQQNDPLFPLATFLDRFDMSTAYPLLLALMDSGLDDAEWEGLSEALESYVLRRAVCGLTNKNYNRIFLSLTRNLRRGSATAVSLRQNLLDMTGESSEWPSDNAFAHAWRTIHVYQTLQNPKIVHIFRRLNDTYASTKSEGVVVNGPLTVEHILPQKWLDHWPLPNGSRGMTLGELWEAAPDDPRRLATIRRNNLLQTIGNLTIIAQPLNSAVSNSSWSVKKPELLVHALLPITQQLYKFENWDEDAIETRSEQLLERALQLWPRDRR